MSIFNKKIINFRYYKLWLIVLPLSLILMKTQLICRTCEELPEAHPALNVDEKNEFIEPFVFSETQIAEIYSKIDKGGKRNLKPSYQNVAIIVPYRNRSTHLDVFLRNIHFFLHEQPINYGIFVVEQIQNQTFNRGKLMNVGFLEALKDDENWNCFIFHDVDLIPENFNISYECGILPTHFSPAIDKFDYKVWPFYFGGVSGMSKQYFQKINGFSNEFWGWGGEDDAMRERIYAAGGTFNDLSPEVGRFRMHRHQRDHGNEEPPEVCRRILINETSLHYDEDGLSTINYTVLYKREEFLYTNLLVDLNEEESRRHSKFECVKKL